MIKNISKKMDKDSARACLDGINSINGFEFGCVEQDGNEWRCISYWNIDDIPVRGQRFVDNWSCSKPTLRDSLNLVNAYDALSSATPLIGCSFYDSPCSECTGYGSCGEVSRIVYDKCMKTLEAFD